MVCDTCGRETTEVFRVVVDEEYDRSMAAPLYNCRACFERKNAERAAAREESSRAHRNATPPA